MDDSSTPTSGRAAPAAGSNPLLDPRDLRMPRIADPCVLVMFGITGDLARHKLLPAIYDLANRGLLSPSFSLVGVGRRSWGDDDLRAYVEQAARAGQERSRDRRQQADEAWARRRERAKRRHRGRS